LHAWAVAGRRGRRAALGLSARSSRSQPGAPSGLRRQAQALRGGEARGPGRGHLCGGAARLPALRDDGRPPARGPRRRSGGPGGRLRHPDIHRHRHPRADRHVLAAVVQARMGSTRLPGKTLGETAGKPLLAHLVERVAASKFVEDVIIATTAHARDDVIASFADARGLKCHRGSETDVLDRIHGAVQRFGVDAIVRVTPDCPLLDPRVVDVVVDAYRSGQYDYVANAAPRTYPDGLDVEVFSRAALERAWREARLPSEREHVTPYLRTSGTFRILNIEHVPDLSSLKWSVDTAEDLEFARAVYAALEGHGLFSMEDVLRVLRERPVLAATNGHSVVNEGYYRSLLADPPLPATTRRLGESQRWKARADAVVPGCSQTFSKAPSQFVQGVAPVFLERGQGCRVWDVDGHEYIDYAMGLGAVILGYGDPDVTRAVER